MLCECRWLVKKYMRDRLKAESNKPPNASLCSRVDCAETWQLTLVEGEKHEGTEEVVVEGDWSRWRCGMDEAEDSKCQTMKDTRKRRTFSNDQTVGINAATDAFVCRKKSCVEKKTNKQLTTITWSAIVEMRPKFFFILENRINHSFSQVCQRDSDWTKFWNRGQRDIQEHNTQKQTSSSSTEMKRNEESLLVMETLGFVRQHSCGKLELGFLWLDTNWLMQ